MKIFVLFLLFLSSLEAKIIETTTVRDVCPHIDEKTWFLVDLDNTLFQGANAIGHANWFYDEVERLMKKGLTREEAFNEFYPTWVTSQKMCSVIPIEKEFVDLIHELQKKGIVVMGFTHRQPVIADATLKQVSSLGIDFTITAPSCMTFELNSKNPTLYKQGVLFVGDFNKKGEIFLPFLAKIEKSPAKVVFIDDKLKNVEEVDRILNTQGIDYVGIYYRAIEQTETPYKKDLAEFQKQFLYRIMTNEEATLLMTH